MIVNNETKLGKGILGKLSTTEENPISYIIKAMLTKFNSNITLLSVSPINEYVVNASLKTANDLKAPITLIASLNQVDYDGGYTGYTQQGFVKLVKDKAKKLNIDSLVFISLDHCGPWLKDKHIELNLSLREAMDDCKKSMENAIKAGYDLIHVDTTVDAESSKPPKPELAAERTIKLIDYAEDLRLSEGLRVLVYEIGSDRWGYRDVEHAVKLVSLVLSGLKRKGINTGNVVFAVGDVGTVVKPGNRLDTIKATKLVESFLNMGVFLKVHSADYVENPWEFPRVGIGGANVGPMFADLMFRKIKELKLIEGNLELSRRSEIINVILSELSKEIGVLKYVASLNELNSLINSDREYLLGIMTRYIWNRERIKHELNVLSDNLKIVNVNLEEEILSMLVNSIRQFMVSFNLHNILNKIFLNNDLK